MKENGVKNQYIKALKKQKSLDDFIVDKILNEITASIPDKENYLF